MARRHDADDADWDAGYCGFDADPAETRNGEFRRGRGSDMFMRIKMLWKCFDIICFASFGGGIDRHTIYAHICFRIHRILEKVKQ